MFLKAIVPILMPVVLCLSALELHSQMVPVYRGRSVIRFSVFDLAGRPAPYEIRKFSRKDKSNIKKFQFGGLEVRNVPQGEYYYELVKVGVVRPRVSTLRGTLVTWKPEHLVTLVETGTYGVTAAGDEVVVDLGGASPLEGKVTGCLGVRDGPCWMRLMNQISGRFVDVTVGVNGAFKIEAPPAGYNVLSVFSSSGFLCNKTLFVSLEHPTHSLEIKCAP